MQGSYILLFSLLVNSLFMFAVVVPVRSRNIKSRSTIDYYFFGSFFDYSAAATALMLHSFALWKQFPVDSIVPLFDVCQAIVLSAVLLPLSFTLVYSTFLAWLIAVHRPDRSAGRRSGFGLVHYEYLRGYPLTRGLSRNGGLQK